MFDIDRDGVGELIAFYSSTTEGKMYVYSSTGALEFERNFGSPIKATYLINSRHFLDESGPHAVQDILVATENKSLYLVYPPGQIQKLTDLSSVPLGQLTKSIDIEPVDGFLNVFVSLSDNKIERVRLKKAANEPNIVSVGSEELLPNLPEVLTLPATLVRTTSARLNGELTDLGGAFSCEVWFEYGTTTSYTDSTLRQVMNAAGTFLADIDGLSPGNTYHFRAVAENIRGRVIGDDMTFNTLVPVSIVVDWNNSNVQSITLRGDVEFSFVNGQAGGIYWLIIKQDSTGGHIAIWDDENIKWADGVPSPPPISISPNAVDIANFVFDGFNYYGTYQRSYR